MLFCSVRTHSNWLQSTQLFQLCYKSCAIFLFLELCAPRNLIPSPDFFEIEIERCLQLAQKNFEVAIKVMSLNNRPLIYVFRLVSDRIRSQRNIIRFWDRLRELTVDRRDQALSCSIYKNNPPMEGLPTECQYVASVQGPFEIDADYRTPHHGATMIPFLPFLQGTCAWSNRSYREHRLKYPCNFGVWALKSWI